MIKTMSIFENVYLVETEESLTRDTAQEIVDNGTSNFYQHHNGELVNSVSVWSSMEVAKEWLHENDYW
jgi:hypothetical protein